MHFTPIYRTTMDTPALSQQIPELWDLITSIGAGVELGTIGDPESLRSRVDAVLTPDRLHRLDAVILGWRSMAAADDGETLRHTVSAAAALTRLDEYRSSSEAARRQMEWTVLLHDLRKEPNGGRDHRHAFRSGAWAGKVLPKLGFPVTSNYQAGFNAWFELTRNAGVEGVKPDGSAADVQDNAKLALILGGVNRMFPSPTAQMVKAILLHQSITVVERWPVAAPLTPDQEEAFLDYATRAILLPLMLADSGGWNLFSPETRREMYAETRSRLGD